KQNEATQPIHDATGIARHVEAAHRRCTSANQDIGEGADDEAVKKLESSAIPLLASLQHHCKEGWPSDSENIAKHPLIARPGWFSDESKRKTTPAASASVASPNFL